MENNFSIILFIRFGFFFFFLFLSAHIIFAGGLMNLIKPEIK